MTGDASWMGNESTTRWDFGAAHSEPAEDLGYEAALPGLQALLAHDARARALEPPAAEAS